MDGMGSPQISKTLARLLYSCECIYIYLPIRMNISMYREREAHLLPTLILVLETLLSNVKFESPSLRGREYRLCYVKVSLLAGESAEKST